MNRVVHGRDAKADDRLEFDFWILGDGSDDFSAIGT